VSCAPVPPNPDWATGMNGAWLSRCAEIARRWIILPPLPHLAAVVPDQPFDLMSMPRWAR